MCSRHSTGLITFPKSFIIIPVSFFFEITMFSDTAEEKKDRGGSSLSPSQTEDKSRSTSQQDTEPEDDDVDNDSLDEEVSKRKAECVQSPKSPQLKPTHTMALRNEFIKSLSVIPMRLTEEERRLLAVLENALDVCEYTGSSLSIP